MRQFRTQPGATRHGIPSAAVFAAGVVLGSIALPSVVPAQTEVDTLVSAGSRTRLEVHDLRGEVTVRTWDRDAVRIVAQSSGERPRIHVDPEVVSVHASVRGRSETDFTLTVPPGMDLSIHGVETDVSVEGTQGRIEIHTVRGDIRVRGGRDVVEIQSVQGSIDVADVRGTVEAQSVNRPVTLTRISGNVQAGTVNAPIRLSGITAGSVEATTVNGEIRYDGGFEAGGSYSFTTHNGTIHLVVPQEANASVDISTFNGEIRAGFPIQTTGGRTGKEVRFTLGNGDARVELETFNGTIRLTRPGQS